MALASRGSISCFRAFVRSTLIVPYHCMAWYEDIDFHAHSLPVPCLAILLLRPGFGTISLKIS